MFSKSCFPLPWGTAMGTKGHTGVGNTKVIYEPGRKPRTQSVIQIRTSVHLSPLHRTKPGINLEKVQTGRGQRGFSQGSTVFSQGPCALECPAVMWQTNVNLALVKFLSTVEWKSWCSKAKPRKGEAQAPALCNLPIICSRGSAELSPWPQ